MSEQKTIRRSARKRAAETGALSGLLAEPRRRKILEWLQEEGSARVRDLSAAFEVSEATIRQDLERLEVDGYVSREHGGAYLKTMTRQVEFSRCNTLRIWTKSGRSASVQPPW